MLAAKIAPQHVPAAPALARLVDHLETALRHGEALCALVRPATVSAFAGPSVPAMIRSNRQASAAAGEAHALELAMILRLTQARAASNEAKRTKAATQPLLSLVEAAIGLVADGEPRTATGAATDFFASRGLWLDSAGEATPIGEGYRIGGKSPLGVVMDAIAAALDMIDTLQKRKV